MITGLALSANHGSGHRNDVYDEVVAQSSSQSDEGNCMTTVTAESQTGRREELWFVARLFVWLLLAVACFFGLMQFRAQFYSPGQFKAKLPDGTWIVVRGISIGTAHSVDVPYPLDVQLRRMQRRYNESHTTSMDRLVMWVTRENDRGAKLDLDWFLRAELDVGDPAKVKPEQYHRQVIQSYSSSGSGAGRTGFGDAKPFGSMTKVDTALIRFAFPLIRPRQGQMRLNVVDGAGTTVATVSIPFQPLPGLSAEIWQPDPLPASRTDGNVTVTLDAVKFYDNPEYGGVSVVPQLSFVHDGQPSKTWAATHELVDLLGNRSQTWNCDLSPTEPAWKLRLTMAQMANGRFTPAESIRLPLRPLAPKGQFVLAGESYTVNGEKVSLIGSGGPGPLEFQLPNSSSEFKTSAYRPGQTSFGTSSRCGNSKCKVEFSSGNPFLITTDLSGQRDAKVEVVLRDQAGEQLTQRMTSSAEGFRFWFFEPKPTSTSVEVELIVQQQRHAEFLISPPKPDEIQKRQ